MTRKSELLERQQRDARAATPFGGFSAIGWGALRRRGRARARLRVARPDLRARGRGARLLAHGARALFAAGFRAGDLVHNSFSYHLTPAGSMMESGAHALGCTVFPGGIGQTEQQVQAIADLQPDGLRRHAELPEASCSRRPTSCGVALPSLTKASVGGEAFPPACATGSPSAASPPTSATAPPTSASIAYETAAREGLVLDEDVIVEIVRPGTGDPVRRRRGRRGRRDDAQPRLPADPLRHRRPLGGAAGRLPDRPHQHAHPGLARPRRPDDQGARHVRAPGPGGRGRAPPSGGARRAWSSAARWPTTA